MLYIKYIFLTFFCLFYFPANAKDFKIGTTSIHHNTGSIVEDQLGGFMTGGSIHTRNRVQDVNLIHIDLPSFKMGCGGIDLHTGSIDYIKVERYLSLIKNLGTNQVAYGALMFAKSKSPMIADVFSQLEATVRDINSLNINSCQLGEAIAGGLLPKRMSAEAHLCASKQVKAGIVDSFFGARSKCQETDTISINEEGLNEQMLGTKHNLVFSALKNFGNKGLKQEEIEEMMSVSGTLVSMPGSDEAGRVKLRIEHKPSLFQNLNDIQVKLFGGDRVRYYKCIDTAKCLQMVIQEEEIKKENSELGKVRELITSLSNKVMYEAEEGIKQKMSQTEENLVITSSIPIIKMLFLEAAFKGHNIDLSLDEYVETIALESLLSQLDYSLNRVHKALYNQEFIEMDDMYVKNFKDEVRFVKDELYKVRKVAQAKTVEINNAKERIMQLENILHNQFHYLISDI